MCKFLNAMQPSGGAVRSEEQKNNEGGGPIVPSDPWDQLTTVANLETGHNCTMFEH
jgi:hypothetical protein